MSDSLFYQFIYRVVWPFFSLFHPIRVIGRENIPEGGAVICPNHSALCDPVMACFAFTHRYQLHPMAKAEVRKVPVLGKLLEWGGVIFVDRGSADVHAIKSALRILKEGQKLLLFPEGTRVRPPKRIPAKSGAAMLATRTDSLVVPVYITPRRAPFVPVDLYFGTPYRMQYEGKKPTLEQLQALSDGLLDEIDAIGDGV